MLTFSNSVENYGDAKGLYSIKKDNYNKFKHILTNQEIKKVEQITCMVMSSLKYEFVNNVSQHDLNIFEIFVFQLHDFLQNYIFHIREKGIIYGIRYLRSLSRSKV